ARRLRSLLKGRLSQETALKLIDDFEGEQGALDFVLNGTEQEVQEYLNKDPNYTKAMTVDAQFVASELDTENETTVSSCRICLKKYDPIRRDKEWGIGKFICDCGNQFAGFGEMNVTSSECYKCNKMVPIKHMLRPRRNRGRKTTAPHSCNGVDCFSKDCTRHSDKSEKGDGCDDDDNSPVCVHPKTGQKILTYSEPHMSTGSTVTTFTRQESLDSINEGPSRRLHDINESD
ncbi:UPF0515 protein isoform X2, partial [Biomphalaria pfeifferi]